MEFMGHVLSKNGIGAAQSKVEAVQNKKQKDGSQRPVYYASCALTDVERCYSKTEREALAIVWACEKCHMCLYG
jgi:hypothetical protein